MGILKSLLVTGPARFINVIKGTVQKSQNGIFYGTCTTAAATAAKEINLVNGENFELVPGVMIIVKFSASNTASNVTFNVNGTGAKSISYTKDTAYTGTTNTICGHVSYLMYYIYDGTYWCFVNNSSNYTNNSNTVPAAQCETAAATAAKVATCTNYTLTANTYLHFNIRYTNSVAGAITMNVNSKGAKPIYINGTASSASNYTLPAGSYIAFYNGTNWYFRTDGKLPGDIEKVNGHTVNSDVPSNAKFTDTNTRRSFFGTCTTAGDESVKEVVLEYSSGWELVPGTIIGVRFTNTNTASNVSFIVNGEGPQYICYDNGRYYGNSSEICGFEDRVNYYMFDGLYWFFLNNSNNAENDTNKVTSVNGQTGAVTIPTSACIIVDCGTISTLPTTINKAAITSSMVCINSYLSNPSAQTGQWEINTANGSVTVSGTINGSTALKLYLVEGVS